MGWLFPIWLMVAAVCGFLALIHTFLWLNNYKDLRYLLPALSATAAAATAIVESLLFSSSSIVSYQTLLLWENLLIALVLVPVVWFLQSYLGTGQRWLAVSISALWAIALFINFAFEGNLTFREVHTLRTLSAPWGESFVVAEGTINPWQWLANLASVLFAIFALDASIRAGRRGRRFQAWIIGGSTVLFILFAGVHTPLVDMGLLSTPYMVSIAFLAIVMGQAYTLAHDAVQVPRLTQKAQADKERWSSLIETVPLAVLGIDPEGRISLANPYLRNLAGFTENELIGHRVSGLVPELEAAELEERIRVGLETEPRAQARWTLRCASGELREFVWSTVREQDPAGNATGLLSVGTDITDQLRGETELRSIQRDMDRLLRVGMLGELTSMLTHELGQPLAAILSNAQAGQRLLGGDNPDLIELREILADIARDDRRASDVISGTRAMLSGQEMDDEPTSPNDAIREIVHVVGSELRANQIQVSLELGDDIAEVSICRVELQQVVMNLILNSVQAMTGVSASRRRIWIRTREDHENVELTVGDSGPGIDRESIESIFEPYYTTRRGGLGLGLSICRRIVQARNGSIAARNQQDGGARFDVFLTTVRQKVDAHA